MHDQSWRREVNIIYSNTSAAFIKLSIKWQRVSHLPDHAYKKHCRNFNRQYCFFSYSCCCCYSDGSILWIKIILPASKVTFILCVLRREQQRRDLKIQHRKNRLKTKMKTKKEKQTEQREKIKKNPHNVAFCPFSLLSI